VFDKTLTDMREMFLYVSVLSQMRA
jgi:hypothetical protein